MIVLKSDRYRSARGGYSRLLRVMCRKCRTPVVTYQKDGPGNLRRLYIDRIFSQARLAGLDAVPIRKIPLLKCLRCKEILGTPYIYQKERRKAFRLYQDAVVKKMRKMGDGCELVLTPEYERRLARLLQQKGTRCTSMDDFRKELEKM